MRILFISTTFPDAASPTRGTYNSALCSALAQEHEVYVVAPRAFPETLSAGCQRRHFQLPEKLLKSGIYATYPTFWYTPKIWQERSGDQMWWSLRRHISKIVDNFRPDAVLSYWAHPEGEVGVRTAQLANIPSAVIVGGSDVLILPKLPRRGPRVRDVLLQSDAVITVSEGLRKEVVRLGVSDQRTQTIYQGIDSAVFHHRQSRCDAQRALDLDSSIKHLVWVGRMVPVKALDVLLDAATTLKQRGMVFQLHLIGDGPERRRLEQKTARLSLQNQIRFVGAVGHDQIATWYQAADLSVLSSDSEGLPNVLRESLACGTPFVSTDVGSLSEIADPDYSTLVPTRDPLGFADAIELTLNESFRLAAAQYRPRSWSDAAWETVQLFGRLRQRFEVESQILRHPSLSLQHTPTIVNQ